MDLHNLNKYVLFFAASKRSMTKAYSSYLLQKMKRQTIKLGAVNDTLLTLGRFLFETLLPTHLQETVRRIDTGLILVENTPEIPWELMFDANAKPGRYLCQTLSIGRLTHNNRDLQRRQPLPDRASARKLGRREAQGLSILFLVNPTGERSGAEEEIASLCTMLPE